MYRKRWITLSLILTLLSITLLAPAASSHPSIARAQASGAPLVFLKDGDLWKWDGVTLTQLSTWGYNERPVLSPDGARVAYNSWATITVNAIAAGKPVMGLIPSNIWILEPATGNAVRAADQPPGASFWQDGVPDAVIMRGTPAWSPDGSRLAWSELVVPEYRFQLVVYDLASGIATAIVPNLPYPYGDGGFVPVHEVMWGNRGILVRNVAVNPTSADFEERAYLYAPDGTLIHETLVGSSATEWVFNMQWTMSNGQQYLGLVYPSGRTYLLDPATGDQQDMPALPELYSTTTPTASATAFVAPNTGPDGSVSESWTVVYPNRQQDQLLAYAGSPKNIAISRDGAAVAYISDAVYVWQNGQVTRVPGTEGIASPWDVALVWGPTAWRVRTDWPGQGGAGMGGGMEACGLAPRLVAGASGQVTPGLPNVIRTQPWRGPDSLILGQIPGGGVFSVLTGPVCDPEGRYWWQVNYQGIVGWTPEGEAGIYWLTPYGTAQPVVSCTLTPRLTPGTTAYVLPGLPNVIRTQPYRGADSLVIGRIPGNGVFSVLSGPVCDPEGRYWWQVSYGGVTGWTAEGERGTYWVSPFGCPSSPPPRLAPGMQGTVTPGAPNTLRVSPGSSSASIGQIPGGGTFTVLSGPQCGPEGWTYWRVQYGNLIGWTAEGSGSTYWLAPGTITPPPPPIACVMTPRLQVGATGRVTPGLPNVLRTQPRRGSDSLVLGQIPAGGVFTVLSGPQCDIEGRNWWQVNYQGLTGWTPEGEAGVYWLEPGGATPPPPPGCPLPPRLALNTSAFVIPGPSNVLRSAPGTGTNSVVIGQIPGGAFFSVVGGPECGLDARVWWQVRYQGVIGWTAEGEGGEYWVSPFACAGGLLTRLVPGGYGRVTPGDPNTLRTAPGPGNPAVGQIPGGGSFYVISGPQCGSDGRAWWQVQYGNLTGWTAEGSGGTYWLEPVS